MRHVRPVLALIVLLTGCTSAPPAHMLCLATCGMSQAAADYQPVPPRLPAPEASPPASTAIEPSQMIEADLDGDGKIDRASAYMRPHSMRLDVDIVLARQANRTIGIMAYEQPATGALVYAKLLPVAPGRYAYACERVDNNDADTCVPGYVQTPHGGVQVTAPGLPTLLVWLDGDKAKVVRLTDSAIS